MCLYTDNRVPFQALESHLKKLMHLLQNYCFQMGRNSLLLKLTCISEHANNINSFVQNQLFCIQGKISSITEQPLCSSQYIGIALYVSFHVFYTLL